MRNFLKSNWFPVVLLLVSGVVILNELIHEQQQNLVRSIKDPLDSSWVPPSLYTDQETSGSERDLVIYGEELIAHTARYFGPKGSIAQISNGMNCQNCHLDAGQRPWGNNYSAVYSTYPKMRSRSGQVENIYKRINDCFERSLNGKAIDTTSREMKAMYTYMKWVGQEVPKGNKPANSGLEKLTYLDRAASPAKGRQIYINQCQSCHGSNGEGLLDVSGVMYAYPPLWGAHSYNDGAGLYRLSAFCGICKK